MRSTFLILAVLAISYPALAAKTDDMGTLQIKWDKIARLTSTMTFLVRTRQGTLHYGTLAEPDRDRMLVVQWRDHIVELAMSDVTGLDQIKHEFWAAPAWVTASWTRSMPPSSPAGG